MAKKHGTGPRILPGMQGYQGFYLVLLARRAACERVLTYTSRSSSLNKGEKHQCWVSNPVLCILVHTHRLNILDAYLANGWTNIASPAYFPLPLNLW
jgi:hypothetical protein